MARAYLDHASSAPLRPGALEAMLPFLTGNPGDPGRLHHEGRVTRVAVETAREQVAGTFGARPREVVFTATGTEAVNAAVWGAVARVRALDDGSGRRPLVITSAIEHSAVLEACGRADVDLTVIGVDGQGRIDADAMTAACAARPALVSLHLANHEVGTVQTAVAAVTDAAHAAGAVVHLDACAAAGHLPVDFAALGVDLCSVTGHPWGAPKGAAALLVRRGLRFPPFVVGGAQERARRAGAENVAAIVGLGAAAAELADSLAREAAAARTLTDALTAAATAVPGVVRHGDPANRLPNLVCLGIDGVEAEPVLLALDQHGVAVHSGSSCSSELLEPSPVLAAMGVDAERSLRASVGWCSTPGDVDAFAASFAGIVDRLRSLRPA